VNLRQFFCHFYFEAFTEYSCISTAEGTAPEAGRYFRHGGMSNTSMGELQNVPASTGGFLHSQNWNFPEEGFILSSSCNSGDLFAKRRNDSIYSIIKKYLQD
jgi:hypothetical protein